MSKLPYQHILSIMDHPFLRRHSNISVGVAIGVVDREMVQRYITDGVRPVIMYLIRRQAVPRILTAKSYIYLHSTGALL